MFQHFKLQTKFVLSFSILFLMIIILIYIFINGYFLKAFENNIIQNSWQLSQKVSQQSDAYIEDFRQITKSFILNSDIIDILKRINQHEHTLTPFESLSYDREFGNYCLSIINFSTLSSSNVYVYSAQNGYSFSYGVNSITSNFEQIVSQDEYRKILQNRDLVVYFNNENTSGFTGSPSISIVRSLNDFDGNVFGYVEIQQHYFMLESICDIGDSGTTYILDDNNQCVYPKEKLDESILDTLTLQKMAGSSGKFYIDNVLHTYFKSADTGWTVIIKHSNQALFSSFYTLRNTTIAVIFLFALISIAAIFLVTLMMTQPIRNLKERVMNISYKDMSLDIGQKTSNDEINLLNDAFQSMMERLRISIEHELKSKEEEMKARFYALQAQIAPHFIHNTLYLISISAQENKIGDAVSLCKKLSDMLRYISSPLFQQVTLEQEIDYTRNYLFLLQRKYEDFLFFNIEIQDSMKHFLFPRLTIQPFVENAVQHAFDDCDPTWIISIRCSHDEATWKIEISDNGSGFEASRLKQLSEQLEHLDYSRIDENESNLDIGGMGIINTALRLKMVFGKELNLQITNNIERGVTVHIQGPVKDI
jgi:two-component system, sensor histidine kinase YesM